jgi:hypothetical protein
VRADWVPHARGEVLEVGIGSGLNLPFYSSEVQRLYEVDPSAELQRMAQTRTANAPMKVEFLSQSVEEPLPLRKGVSIQSSLHGRSVRLPTPLGHFNR